MPSAIEAQTLCNPLPFLNLNTDPASAGRGNTNLATEGDANSGFANPAKLPWLVNENNEPQTMFAVNYRTFNGAYLASAIITHADASNEGNDFFLGARWLNGGSATVASNNGNDLRDFTLEGGATKVIGGNWSTALVFKVIRSSIIPGLASSGNNTVTATANALAGDLSFSYNGKDERNQGLTFGFALKNVGVPLFYDDKHTKLFLPSDIGAGLAYTAVSGNSRQFVIAVDIHKSLAPQTPHTAAEIAQYQKISYGMFQSGSAFTYGLGAEYKLPFSSSTQNAFTIRAGYIIDSMDALYSGFTAGAGLCISNITINMAYFWVPSVSTSPYGNTFQFGISKSIR
jgi:hypothetical protein